jgi:hypothetical protein
MLNLGVMKSANRSRSSMMEVSFGSIEYLIISQSEAAVQSCSDSVETLLPRNCLAFCGNRVRVVHLEANRVLQYTETFLIPYSLSAIFWGGWAIQLKYLVFEMGSELWSIDYLNFQGFSSIFVPQSVRFIGSPGLANTASLASVFFLIATLL